MKDDRRLTWRAMGGALIAVLVAGLVATYADAHKTNKASAKTESAVRYVDEKDLTPGVAPATVVRSFPVGKSGVFRTEITMGGAEYYFEAAFRLRDGFGIWVVDRNNLIFGEPPNAMSVTEFDSTGVFDNHPVKISSLNFIGYRRLDATRGN